MQYKGFFFLLGLALMLGWVLAGPDPLARPAVTEHTAQADSDPPGAAEPAEYADEAVLARQQDGHFYADVDVGSDEIRFIVDTGATGIALTGKDAAALGFSWSDDELSVVGRGVSGNVYGKRIRLPAVRLGNVESADVEAVIIPTGLDVSLLGQSFLSKASSVKIENDEMTIS